MLYAVFGAGALGQLSEVWNEVSQAAGAAARIGELLAVKPRIAAPAVAGPARQARSRRARVPIGRLRLSGPRRGAGAERRRAFASRRARSSRSSARRAPASRPLFQLALRFYDPTARRRSRSTASTSPGSIRRSCAREIALVPQEPFIFGASVADNIAYGAPDATREAIVAAARQAAADGFISALPQGYDTELGERGVTLSGGERQRIAIARAHPQGRAGPAARRGDLGARRGERNAGAGRARNADEGPHDARHRPSPGDHRQRRPHSRRRGRRIVEEGTHATLLAAGGLYARLARLQFETGAAALTAIAEAAQ